MKKAGCIIVFIFIVSLAYSQSVGYAGKRLLIKQKLFDGRRAILPGMEFEYVTGRKTSFALLINRVKHPVEQTFNESDPVCPEASFHSTFTTFKFGLEWKQYFATARLFPAPRGAFFYMTAWGGFRNLRGKYPLSLVAYDTKNNACYEKHVEYTLKRLPFVAGETGFGYQNFFNKRFTWSFKTGFSYSKGLHNLDQKEEAIASEALSEIRHGNVWKFLSVHGSLGILLF